MRGPATEELGTVPKALTYVPIWVSQFLFTMREVVQNAAPLKLNVNAAPCCIRCDDLDM